MNKSGSVKVFSFALITLGTGSRENGSWGVRWEGHGIQEGPKRQTMSDIQFCRVRTSCFLLFLV